VRESAANIWVVMDVWQGVSMDSLKYHTGQPWPTLLRLAGRPHLKRSYDRLLGDPPTGLVACDRLYLLGHPTPYQARTGRGIYGLPKVSYRLAMADPYTPCGWTTPQTALRPFGGWPAYRAGDLRPSSSPLDTPSRTGLPPLAIRL
jgi:hypothetical protein